MSATIHPSRREFLRTGAVVTGGLVIAFAAPGGQAFDGRDLLSFGRRHGCDAGPFGSPIEVDGTGAALRDAAAELGAGEADQIAEDPEEGHIGWGVYVAGGAVDGQFHGRSLDPG